MSADIIERLEKATGPDRVLDVDIGCELNGLSRSHFQSAILQAKDEWVPDAELWPLYTASIDAALTLVPEGWSWRISVSENRLHPIVVLGRSYPTNRTITQEAKSTPAIAVCIAALNAREIDTPQTRA